MLRRFLESPVTERAILTLIPVDAITLGLETGPGVMRIYGPLLQAHRND